MTAIDYARFTRTLNRCEEIAGEPGMKASVVLTYTQVLEAASGVYRTADDGVTKAASAFAKENKEAHAALAALDGPYREARSMAAAFVTGIKLPDTLKVQATDTDKVDAIESLLSIVDDHQGEAWADLVLKGDLGAKGQATILEINEAIEANKGLSEARSVRAAAFGPAYEQYLKFKRVVRDALGAKSKQYKRIHVREGHASSGEEGPPVVNGAGGAGNTPAPGGNTQAPGGTP
jgi:phosphotransferase system HPr-like phosphotransfer protein